MDEVNNPRTAGDPISMHGQVTAATKNGPASNDPGH